MPYIWVNPVTARMYEPDELNKFLHQHGYYPFEIREDWLTVVKEKYRLVVQQASSTVMDVRCPKVRELLEECRPVSNVTIPEIKPILIHCGQEGSEREDLQGKDKIITTPCQALADMGNALELKNTRFVPWNQFIASIGSAPKAIPPKESPIPPGFFEELGFKTVSVTGEEEIRQYLEQDLSDKVQLVEMLFCREGCHNGDGIKICEE